MLDRSLAFEGETQNYAPLRKPQAKQVERLDVDMLQSIEKREEFEREVGAGLEEVNRSNASVTSEGKWKGLHTISC